MSQERARWFVACAQGLESLCDRELAELGVTGRSSGAGGVSFQGAKADGARVCVQSTLALQVRARLVKFPARHFRQLEQGLGGVDWEAWIGKGGRAGTRVSSVKSRLFHTEALGERVERALSAVGVETSAKVEDDDGSAHVWLQLRRDEATVWLAVGGEPLHRQGWRRATSKAPLREDFGAALLRAAGWRPEDTLLDPLCGSGTIPILAARSAGAGLPVRRFAFENLPGFPSVSEVANVDDARGELEFGPILGSDRDAGAIESATANAARAEIGDSVRWSVASVSDALASLELVPERTVVVTNPPWGHRVGGPQLHRLYAALGRAIMARGIKRYAFATTEPALASTTGLPTVVAATARHGGLPLTLYTHPPNGR